MVTHVTLDELQTPALLLDAGKFERNARRMEDRAAALGVALRPHLKTAKSLDVARAIPSARTHGITVSTAKEAEYFAGGGVIDLLYAVAVTPAKLARLAEVVRRGSRVCLAVDSLPTARAVVQGAEQLGATFDVAIEIDSGEHRSGMTPADPELSEVGSLLHGRPGARLWGVFTHAGHSYGCRSVDEVRAVAEGERAAAVAARDALVGAGLACPNVSVGSTPTATHAAHLEGVTELRAGVYLFQDLFQAGVGSCSIDDIAASVLTTVIGHQPRHGRLLVDAGGLALSKDRSTAALGPDGDCGYGLVTDTGGAVLSGLQVVDAYQEHGVIEAPTGIDFDRHPVGTQLRILPNHACMTCSAYDRYHVVQDHRVAAVWPRIHEWI